MAATSSVSGGHKRIPLGRSVRGGAFALVTAAAITVVMLTTMTHASRDQR